MFPAPMDFSVDMSCEMKVNRNCELCQHKVSEIMHCLTAVYSVDFVGDDNTIKLKARANPNLLLGIIQKYGDHGKLSKFHMDGEPILPRPGGGYNGQSGYYLPSNAPGNYPYPSPYGYPMPNPPPQQTEPPRGVNKQQTDHGKLSNFHKDVEPILPRPGGGYNGQSGYYLPSNAPANYPYPSPYGNPMPNPPPRQTEAPRGVNKQHTAPPPFDMQPPPPKPLSSYSYIEPPYWPTSSSSGGKCVIM